MQSLNVTTNVVDMLRSVDKEDHVVGLCILEQWHLEKDIIPLMLCYKMGYPKSEEWDIHAPMAMQELTKVTTIRKKTGVTWQSLFNSVVLMEAPVEYVEYVMKGFSNHLTSLVILHPKIKSIELKIETNE